MAGCLSTSLFIWGRDHPCSIKIATGYEGVKQYSQENIIYLISSFDQIKKHNLAYFFSDGHVRSKTSTTYAAEEDFDLLDWDAIYATRWQPDENDLLRKQKKQAEFLVKERVPFSCVEYVGVFNRAARQKVVNLLVKHGLPSDAVKMSPQKLYYDHL